MYQLSGEVVFSRIKTLQHRQLLHATRELLHYTWVLLHATTITSLFEIVQTVVGHITALQHRQQLHVAGTTTHYCYCCDYRPSNKQRNSRCLKNNSHINQLSPTDSQPQFKVILLLNVHSTSLQSDRNREVYRRQERDKDATFSLGGLVRRVD